MKTQIKNPFLLPALVAVLNLIPASRVTAQTFTTLHSFTPTVPVDDGHFHFTFTNSDGAAPNAGLIANSSGTTLYGTANRGGSSGRGTVFAVNPDATGFTNLHNFDSTNGAFPLAGLILSGTTLYRTAQIGGSSNVGTVFALNTDGTGFTNLHHFAGYPSDGSYPVAGLVLSGTILYGTAQAGGNSGRGTVFAVNTDGTGYTNLYSFTQAQFDGASQNYTNRDGYNPTAGLILLGDTLYATAQFGGSTGHGTVFALNTDGTSFTNLHDFAGYPGDGTTPASGLILLANKLYGTAPYGGSSSNGTVFGLLTDGTGFTNLHHCTTFALNYTNSDGANPLAGLVILRNNLYGTASQGGRAGNGTVFSLALAPPTLNISVSGPYTTLKWPANDPAIFASGFHVQTTTDPLPLSPATIWVNLPAVPSIMNGEFTVILANSYAAQRVYRLWQ